MKPITIQRILDIYTDEPLLHYFTVRRIKEEHFWKKLEKDVENYISSCDVCKRNNTISPKEHPAKTLAIKGVFDRIGIDLVFGLPQTKEGYIGLFVVSEYLTKFPYVEPIKGKTAVEIAEKLWNFVCLFGPSKVVLSDQGTEFNNAVVDNLIRRVGAEHVVTSAYHPRTNGQVERFNGELVKCLRRHCEQNPEDWPKWIPYVLLAYRTRVHSSTLYSPFELMFGRKMNGFENWSSIETEFQNNALEERVKEIRYLMEEGYPDALKNIKKSKEKQLETQNKSRPIVETPIPIGTKVWISIPGLHDKLHPKYRGPYTIIGITKNDNYIVEDALKRKIEDTFSRQRLKIDTNPNMLPTQYHLSISSLADAFR